MKVGIHRNMKIIATLIAITTAAQSSSAFVVGPRSNAMVTKATAPLQMGILDFFSEDARKAREEQKQQEVEEQERLQRQIMDRRRNPEKMEEYEAKVRVRRALRMAGEDDAAQTVDIYGEEDVKIQGIN